MSWFKRAWGAVKEAIDRDKKRIGGMHPYGMGAQGLGELRAAFSFEGSVAQPTEYGVFGKVTQGEIADARKDEGTVHGPASDERDPVASAREQASASAAVQRQRDGNEAG